MDNLDLSSYYDKLSEIRAKVLNKNRDRQQQISSKYEKQNTNIGRHYRIIQKKEEESSQRRKPLEDKVEKQTNILDRVRDLDTVNEKIKLILASKREPYSTHQRVASSFQRNNIQMASTPKKMTSLFQNENNIVQSKVTSSNNKGLSKEKRYLDFQFKFSDNRKTLDQRGETIMKKQIQESSYIPQKSCEDLPLSLQVQPKHQKSFFIKEQEKIFQDIQRQTFSFNIKEEPLKRSSALQTINKPQLMESLSRKKPETNKLVSILIKQIELDSKLRQSKEKYHNFKDKIKFQQLKTKVLSKRVDMAEKEIQDWVHMSIEESNPFLEYIQQSTFDYQELADCLVVSWEFWNNQVKESVTITSLEEEGFKIQEIDLGNKGYLTLQDFVCFLNLNSDSCFRNRDAVNMFRRWNGDFGKEKSDNRLKYQTFLSYVAK